MIGKEVQCIVLGIEDRIKLVEEGRCIFSRKFILERLPDGRRGLVDGQQDQLSGFDGFEEVCRSILVAIAIFVDFLKVSNVSPIICFFHGYLFHSHNKVPTIKEL